jgi:cytochrome bd-type quinol oxidase subunit 2
MTSKNKDDEMDSFFGGLLPSLIYGVGLRNLIQGTPLKPPAFKANSRER